MALPVTLTSLAWPITGSGNVGPFISSGGSVYVFGHITNSLSAYKATDPTSSFSEQDSGNRPSINLVSTIDVFQAGDIFKLVSYNTATGVTYYAKFDASSDTWQNVDGDAKEKTVHDVTDVGGSAWVSITARSTGDVIIHHPGEAVTDMGQDVDSTAYSRLEIDGVTNFTDGTNGLEFVLSSGQIVRSDGGSWITDGFIVDSFITVTNAEDAGNNVTAAMTAVTASTLTLAGATLTNNALDTTAVVTQNDTGWTTGIAVFNTGPEKGQRRRHGYAVMDSNDRCMFTCIKEDGVDFLLRALSADNNLQTERVHLHTDIQTVRDGAFYTRSATGQVAFLVSAVGGRQFKIYFDEFAIDNTNPTFVQEDIVGASLVDDNSDFFHAGYAIDPNDANQTNYSAYIADADDDLQLRSDGGGTTWGDENGGTEIVAGTIDGVSANIYIRGTDIFYAYVYNDAGTTKYNEFDIGDVVSGLGPPEIITMLNRKAINPIRLM